MFFLAAMVCAFLIGDIYLGDQKIINLIRSEVTLRLTSKSTVICQKNREKNTKTMGSKGMICVRTSGKSIICTSKIAEKAIQV